MDKLGTNIATRQNMYDPLYYLRKASEGFGSSVVAKHWRINTGLMQGDTASTTEVNLYLSLKALEGAEVKDVEFTTVWDLPHVEAERAGGDYRENFIDWVFASEGNNVNRVIRASGAGEATVVEEAPAGSAVQSPYTIADGYDKCAVFEYTFKDMGQTVPIMASADNDVTKINLQFDFFEDKQDVTVELIDGVWTVIADKSGFLGTDGLNIAALAVKLNQWQNPLPFDLAPGYDLYAVIDYYFADMDQTVRVLACADQGKANMNLQFDFFEATQDVTLALQDGAWVVTADKSGFMGTDDPKIADQVMSKGVWQTVSRPLESPYEPAVGYELYTIFEYYFADMDQTVVVLASANTVQTRMNLQFDFFEDKQDVSLELVNGEWTVTEDASGFMGNDARVMAANAVALDAWIIK